MTCLPLYQFLIIADLFTTIETEDHMLDRHSCKNILSSLNKVIIIIIIIIPAAILERALFPDFL